MRPLATWNLLDDTIRWGRRPPTGKGKWRINMWIKRGEESASREIIPSEPVYLRELLNTVLTHEVDALLEEVSCPDNMGFEVFKWR